MEKVGEIVRRIKDRLTKDGLEKLDPTPMEPPIGYKRQPSIAEQVREMVRSERLQREVEAAGAETFEEADDFDIPDDPPDPHSKWENDFEPSAKDVKEAEKAAKAAKEKATKEAREALNLEPEKPPAQ